MMKINVNQAVLEVTQGDVHSRRRRLWQRRQFCLAGAAGWTGDSQGMVLPIAELKAKYEGCPTGSAVITGGGKLKAKYVIHAVGPRYSGTLRDAELLASAYRKSLELCTQHKISSVAFPSISTGIYGYPVEEASRIALKTVTDYLKNHPEIKLVRFVLYDSGTYRSLNLERIGRPGISRTTLSTKNEGTKMVTFIMSDSSFT
jgi:O-acetyl-ADP-ribose deacetylase (regulator of RNase III)